jgi:hypothetical protein
VLLRELTELARGPIGWDGWANFDRLLDINTPEAHLAAAMMLVPEGWGVKLTKPRPDEALESVTGPLPCVVVLLDPEKALPTGTGPTPAHALIAARAMRHGPR